MPTSPQVFRSAFEHHTRSKFTWLALFTFAAGILFIPQHCVSVAQFNQDGDSPTKSDKPKGATTRDAAASIDDLAWIAGHWQGKAMGGEFEETWNPPFGGTMMGMFKFVEAGEIKFYELLTIVEEKESMLLRLKHFDKSLNGWEEKDKSIEFPLVEITASEAKFDGLKFVKVDASTMRIIVTTKDSNGKQSELLFHCKRAKSSPSQ